MSRDRQRELRAAYKERKIAPGVFAVRCAASGQVWVQGARNLDGQENRLNFALKLGQHQNPAVSAALRAHGPESFSFEILEVIEDDDLEPYVLDQRLKDMTTAWRTQLSAKPLAG